MRLYRNCSIELNNPNDIALAHMWVGLFQELYYEALFKGNIL